MSMFGGTSAAAKPDGSAIKDGTDASFVDDVIKTSQQTPVIVDFWAPWCGPCRQLGPMIERAVTAARGAVRLVKINIDENPGIAGQMRVQSIPAVYAFKDGKPVDGFMGAQPESQIKAFVERLAGESDVVEEADALVERGKESLRIGDMGGAAQDFAAALQIDPKSAGALAGMARCYWQNGDLDGAKGLLAGLDDKGRANADVKSIEAAIELAEQAPKDSSDISKLRTRVEKDPEDLQARYELAQALSASGDLDGAADHLIHIISVERDWHEGAARALLLKIFEAAGPESTLAVEGRKRLSSVLFS